MFFDIYEKLCKERGITVSKAAEEMGINKGTVSAWRNKGTYPQVAQLQKMAAFFSVSTDYLLGLDTEGKAGPSIVFYDQYCKLCENLGKSPSAVAIEIGISKSAVSTWKNMGRVPKIEQLSKIADYFGVPVDYLLGHEAGADNVSPIQDELIAFYGDVKADLTPDDIDDLMVAMRAKAERNKRRKSGE